MPGREGVDVDAVMAEVRERVRRKREQGAYDADLAAALATPLPGGVTAEDGTLVALRAELATDVTYDPRSERPLIGPLITFARRTAIWLLRWWMHEIVARQGRIDRLILAALERERAASAAGLEERVSRLERAWSERAADESASQLDYWHFADRFGGAEEHVRELYRPFAELFRGRGRVVDLGSGRGSFLHLMKETGVGAYGVDLDARLVELCRQQGLEAVRGDALAHLQGLADASLDGLFAAHLAEHVEPGYLLRLLKEARRLLRAGSPLVFVTPNARNLSVGAHTFWTDPSHRRPVPPDLFRYYLEWSGFTGVEVRTYSPMEARLSEDVPDGAIRANVHLLNETLFGDRDCALIARAP